MSEETTPLISEDSIVSLMASAIAEMPRDHVIKWVLALESKLYKQGRAALISNSNDDLEPSYCCLGLYDKVVFDLDDATIRVDDFEGHQTLPGYRSDDFESQEPFFSCNDGLERRIGDPLDGIYVKFPSLDFLSIARLIRLARPDVFPPKEA